MKRTRAESDEFSVGSDGAKGDAPSRNYSEPPQHATEAQSLLLYVQMNRAAVRKVLKKYDKLRLRRTQFQTLPSGSEYLQTKLRSTYGFLGGRDNTIAELKALAFFERDIDLSQDAITGEMENVVPEIRNDDFR